MHIDWWTLGLQAVNVLILIWLLSRYLFRPIADMLTARQAAADKLLADAQAQKDAAARETEELRARNAGFEQEAQRRRADMQAAVEDERQRLLAKAKAEAAALSRQVASETEAACARMTVELENRAADLAASMAGKLLGRLPPERTTEALFAALLERIAALAPDERTRLAQDAPLVARTPAALGVEDQHRYAEALRSALPGMAAPAFVVDPALIAGFELGGSHMRVRNSWRADLDDMLAALKDGRK